MCVCLLSVTSCCMCFVSRQRKHTKHTLHVGNAMSVHYFAFCPTFSSENSLDENLLGTASMHMRIILELYLNEMWECGLYSAGLAYGPMAGFCELGNEPLLSIICWRSPLGSPDLVVISYSPKRRDM